MSEFRVTSAKVREQDRLFGLLQDYLAEFDEFEDVEKNEDGTYVYPFLPHYWEDPNRYPFLFRADDELAGFALLRFEVDPASGYESMDMAEFYVVPNYRRNGYGREAARRWWDLFPGRWIVRVPEEQQERASLLEDGH
ncbi:MAG: GNAT family N-acetyltransferase [Gammaproteobacteria bacterium]|nr:GNAT family N-acetyltransferase [Gammaproteobacteria bacterium]